MEPPALVRAASARDAVLARRARLAAWQTILLGGLAAVVSSKVALAQGLLEAANPGPWARVAALPRKAHST
jgi:hypothetical protein